MSWSSRYFWSSEALNTIAYYMYTIPPFCRLKYSAYTPNFFTPRDERPRISNHTLSEIEGQKPIADSNSWMSVQLGRKQYSAQNRDIDAPMVELRKWFIMMQLISWNISSWRKLQQSLFFTVLKSVFYIERYLPTVITTALISDAKKIWPVCQCCILHILFDDRELIILTYRGRRNWTPLHSLC